MSLVTFTPRRFFEQGSNEQEASAVETDDGYSKVADKQESESGWTNSKEAEKLFQEMFKQQMNVYLGFQAVLAVCNIAIQLWGRIFVHKSNFLGCTDGGNQWLYTTIQGELFIGAHMVLIITQAVMLEQALYKVPKKLGWFDHSNESVLLADDFEEAKPSKKHQDHSEEGDGFKAIN